MKFQVPIVASPRVEKLDPYDALDAWGPGREFDRLRPMRRATPPAAHTILIGMEAGETQYQIDIWPYKFVLHTV